MPFSVSVLVATSTNAQASLCQTIWPSTFKDLESSLLAGYNITCKALEISAIMKGSRGKRDSNIVLSSTLGEDTSLSRWKTGFDSR